MRTLAAPTRSGGGFARLMRISSKDDNRGDYAAAWPATDSHRRVKGLKRDRGRIPYEFGKGSIASQEFDQIRSAVLAGNVHRWFTIGGPGSSGFLSSELHQLSHDWRRAADRPGPEGRSHPKRS